MGEVIDIKTRQPVQLELPGIPAVVGPIDRRALVREFNEAFNPPKETSFHITMILEEAREVREAAAHLLKELADLNYVMTGAILAGVDLLPAELLDEVKGLSERWGAHVPDDVSDESFRRVHVSNMSKLDEKGRVLRRKDGKVLKSTLYQEPNLMDLA